MDTYQFTMNGEPRRLSREQVQETAGRISPEPLQTWSVVVDGRRFPVKQLLSESLGVSRADFISHRARDIFRRLGFEVFEVGRPGLVVPWAGALGADQSSDEPPRAPSGPTTDPPAMYGHETTKERALRMGIEFTQGRAGATPEDALAAAQKFEVWLRQTE